MFPVASPWVRSNTIELADGASAGSTKQHFLHSEQTAATCCHPLTARSSSTPSCHLQGSCQGCSEALSVVDVQGPGFDPSTRRTTSKQQASCQDLRMRGAHGYKVNAVILFCMPSAGCWMPRLLCMESSHGTSGFRKNLIFRQIFPPLNKTRKITYILLCIYLPMIKAV